MGKIQFLIDQKNPHLGGSIVDGDQNTWSPKLWDFVIDDLGIKSMIDVGCGEGFSTKYFINKGIDAYGVEGLYSAYERSGIKDKIYYHDYTEGKIKIKQEFDLTWSCKFVEHVDEKYMHNFLDTFSKSKHILMTHAFPNQGGYHHVNCQNPDYWIYQLQQYGYEYDYEYTVKLRELTEPIAIYAKQSLLYFKKK